ncbi:uncharacterized protein NDAI_0K02720 [Naumovozyma dairenensis CBS 421]|uniref:Aspartate aminotransferase n=1 Tax=Naumovozyma dairenensis (strain ATCC 10597 / BCRC 20456 / CBS 421 / NBRC 0211 / NRRL Y-12639) TaxID=1071378 RepID=G0WI52_NAUDC|nr:hypothetical protein NDAI_0K02720 [Naumovozyma dairenensis CBS 421]CCD27463.1 hypothetical protein NDAI_0K02720 [Naumovozyma dairenensis CBS 421]
MIRSLSSSSSSSSPISSSSLLTLRNIRYFSSLIKNIPLAPADKILGLTSEFNHDQNNKKVNLTVGIYKDAFGKVTPFPSVRQAQNLLNKNHSNSKYNNLSYLPITGCKDFETNVTNFLFNDSINKPTLIEDNRISFIQTLSGTGAISIASTFITKFLSNEIIIPNYSWANHSNILQKNGFKNNINHYPYYDPITGKLSINKWKQYLRSTHSSKSTMPRSILLHASCHNPTGVDPTLKQWEEIIDIIHELKMIPIIDMAYQGLETGNLFQDCQLLKLCLDESRYPKGWKNGLFLCQSFAKNMGLYGERVGSLSIVLPPGQEEGSPESVMKDKINSQLKRIVRGMYSSPPGYGSKIANIILSEPDLKLRWIKDVKFMVDRLNQVRLMLYERLNWNDLINNELIMGCLFH